MKYLADIFNTKIIYSEFSDTDKLPYFIRDDNDFEYATINGIKTIFMYPRLYEEDVEGGTNTFNYNSAKAQIKQLCKIFNLPVVLVLENISLYQRNLLTKNNIAFVVPDIQAYLPFMGVALLEEYKKQFCIDNISPSTQMILLYLIYKQEKLFYLADVEHELGLSKMTVTRAFKELSCFDGVEIAKEGVKRVLKATKRWEDIFTVNITRQIDPIKKKIYIDKKDFESFEKSDFVLSGETAISKYTMINEPAYKTYATGVNLSNKVESTPSLQDPTSQVCIEIWRYDPRRLTKLFYDGKYADFLSVWLSVDPYNDARLDKELDIANKKFWKEHNA